MKREQLEHVLRAAAQVADARDIIVLGSQAILGSVADDELPLEATRSIEVDLAFVDDRDRSRADAVDGAIGELSRFHQEFGYYPHGVEVSTARLPGGWRDRLVVLDTANTKPGRGLCLEPHDLVASKLAAWRTKDREYAHALLGSALVDRGVLLERIRQLEGVPVSMQRLICDWVETVPSREDRGTTSAG
jgi:hypothetical protein